MKYVHLVQLEGGEAGLTWTVTVHVGAEETDFTLESATAADLRIPCDSLDIERSGFSPVTVTPDPTAYILLTPEPLAVQTGEPVEEQTLFALLVGIWAFLFYFLFS